MKAITIAGGGLAGLSVGIALRKRGIPVEIHEAGSYPRHRVCGEFISGLSQETITTLGIEDALSDCHRHRSTAWFLQSRQVFSDSLPEPALAISRYALDVRLAEIFTRLGGELHERSRVRNADEKGVVWAAGRRVEKGSSWVGLKAHFHHMPLTHGLEMHLGDGSYVGVSPVEDGRVNVCGLFKDLPGLKASGAQRLIETVRQSGMIALVDRLDQATPDEASFSGVSAIRFGEQATSSQRCSLGDAHSMIPPFTGNGMTMAFQAAESALPFLVSYANGKSSWQQTSDAIAKSQRSRFRRRLNWSRWLHPVLCSGAGQKMIALISQARLLPFQQLYRAVR
jgi:2-polyprenyl-6-methoxyphenol hydroxylase-like FAD-dependent oxidoreductase